MRYSTESKYRVYVTGYGLLPFARKFGDKYGKKLMDTATKTVVQKTAEGTGDSIGNKIADKITTAGKSKEDDKAKKTQEINIPPEKKNWWHYITLSTV